MPFFSCIMTECRKAVAAPAEHGVGPVHAEEDAAGEKEPGDESPDAGDLDPFFAGIAHHERAEGEGEGDGESDVAQIKHGWMDDHLGVLEEGIEAVAVVRERSVVHGEGRRGEVEDGEEEDLDAGEDSSGVGEELDVGFVGEAEDEAVGGEKPGPEEERALLAGPESGELVGAWEGAVGVLHDVGDGEVVGEDRVDEGESGGGDSEETGDAGAAGGVCEALG